jgi:hypothetical protein
MQLPIFSIAITSIYKRESFTMLRNSSLVFALSIALSGAVHADQVNRPVVPATIEVGAIYKPFLAGHAIGTQNYICAPAATPTGLDWLPIGPQATLFNTDFEQIITHFQSKNPYQGDALHATWQHSRDTSAVWATKLVGSVDPDYVAPGAIEWLKLQVTGWQIGPTGGDKLAGTQFIQRVNTVGGVKPPAPECTASTMNTRKLVSYEADYYFYR